MRKKNIDANVVILLVFTLITMLSWIGFEVYHSYYNPKVPDVSNLLTPLDSKLDTDVLQILEQAIP